MTFWTLSIITATGWGILIGGCIENYRARVVWGFPLGKTWKPPGDDVGQTRGSS